MTTDSRPAAKPKRPGVSAWLLLTSAVLLAVPIFGRIAWPDPFAAPAGDAVRVYLYDADGRVTSWHAGTVVEMRTR